MYGSARTDKLFWRFQFLLTLKAVTLFRNVWIKYTNLCDIQQKKLNNIYNFIHLIQLYKNIIL